jgi:uncharacterized membrane protein
LPFLRTGKPFRRLGPIIALMKHHEETPLMSDLIAIEFADPALAFELRAELAKLQKEYLIKMEDAVVVTREADGKVKLHQAVSLTAAGAISGGLWGTLIGMIFLNPLLGAAIGAGSGALSGALTDLGISDKLMKEMGEALPPGGSALFLLVRSATADKVMKRIEGYRGKGKVLRTSLNQEREDALRALFEGPAAS